jgi:WD40 repeat protein
MRRGRQSGGHLAGHLLTAVAAFAAAVCLTGTARAQQSSERPPTEPILRIETGLHGALIHRIDTDAENHFAVTASDDKTVRLWSLPDGRPLQVLRLPLNFGNVGKAYAVAISPDGRTIAASGWTGSPSHHSIFLFDRVSGALTKRLSDLPDSVRHLAYSPNGQRLAASLSGSNGIRVFDTGNGYRPLPSDAQYRESSYWATFDQAGRLLTTSDDGYVRLYAADQFARPIHRILMEDNPYVAAFSPDGDNVAVGFFYSHRVVILSGSDLNQLFEANTAGVADRALKAVAWSQDGHFLFAGGDWSESDVWLIRRWSDSGRGAFVDIPAASETIMEILPLKSGSMLFAHTDGYGLISPDTTVSQLQGLGGLDLRSETGLDMRVSVNGRTVEIDSWQPRHTYRFSLDKRRVDIDPPLDGALQAPVTQAPGLHVTDWYDSTTPAVEGMPLKLELDEMARSLAFMPGTQKFVLGADWSVHFFDHLGRDIWPVSRSVPGEAFHVNVTHNGRLAVIGYGDGTIRWLRLSDGEELLALFIHPDGRWIAWTPQGYYDASVGGDELIGWHVNHGYDTTPDFYRMSQFRDQFNRPDVVALVLDALDVDEAARQANRASGRNAPAAVAENLPPVVDILSPADWASAAESPIAVTYQVRSPTPVTGIIVKVDGRPPAATPQKLGPSKDGIATLSITIPEHDAIISLFATNEKGHSGSSHVHIKWRGAPDWYKPNLFVLAVGVSHYKNKKLDLTFPHKDAKDFLEVMRVQKNRFYRDVFSRLPSDRATRDQILDGLHWLQRRTNKRDVAMLFLSGHGEQDPYGHYHYLPFNADLSDFNMTTIEADEMRLFLRDIPGKVIAFVDSYHSGGLNLEERPQPDVNRLANDFKSDGIVVLSSSTGNEASLEKREWNNGAFTKALVEAFKGGINQSNKISIGALEDYLERRVKELTHDAQHPTLARPETIENYNDYVIGATLP